MIKKKNLTTADSVYEEIRRQIMEGLLGPGERLIEDKLAKTLNTSRTPIRHALARAAAEGLIVIAPNRGATVRDYSRQDLMEIYDLRALLEGHAAYRAALRIRKKQCDYLDQQVAAMADAEKRHFTSNAKRVQYLLECNHRFHTTIYKASGNSRLLEILQRENLVPLQFRSFYWYSEADLKVSDFYHQAIVRALRLHEADRARSNMQEHLYFARDRLLGHLILD